MAAAARRVLSGAKVLLDAVAVPSPAAASAPPLPSVAVVTLNDAARLNALVSGPAPAARRRERRRTHH